MVLFILIEVILLIIAFLFFRKALECFNIIADMALNKEDWKSTKYKKPSFQGTIYVFLITITLSLGMVLILIPELRIYILNFLKL